MEINPLHILWSNNNSFMEPLSVPDPTVTVFGEVTMFDTAAMAIVRGDPLGLEVALKSGQGLVEGDLEKMTSLACLAAYHGQDACLRIFQHFQLLFYGSICLHAADAGHLPCLRLAHQLGDCLTKHSAGQAAAQGHAHCLAFAMENASSDFHDLSFMLYVAIMEGHLTCVELLATRFFPEEAYLHAPRYCVDHYNGAHGRTRYMGPMTPTQLRCLQHVLDSGCRIHPGTLVTAAMRGDTDFVRWLHSRGVPLWEHAWGFRTQDTWRGLLPICACSQHTLAVQDKPILGVPDEPEAVRHMWGPLMYGAAHGAPVTYLVADMMKAQRSAACAVLLSFHAASRLSLGEGSAEQRAAWAVMRRVPSEIIEKILGLADLEISKSLHYILRDVKLDPDEVFCRKFVEAREEEEELKRIEALKSV